MKDAALISATRFCKSGYLLEVRPRCVSHCLRAAASRCTAHAHVQPPFLLALYHTCPDVLPQMKKKLEQLALAGASASAWTPYSVVTAEEMQATGAADADRLLQDEDNREMVLPPDAPPVISALGRHFQMTCLLSLGLLTRWLGSGRFLFLSVRSSRRPVEVRM
jgi:hypothetical protein